MTAEHIPAYAVHSGDELVFTVSKRCAGTTACSALDAKSGATNFVIITIIADDPDSRPVTVVAASESIFTRAIANTAIGAAA